MAAYISKKTSLLRWGLSFFLALAAAALLSLLLEGPVLGLDYDFLQRRRSSAPVSREILIIDSSLPGQDLQDDILEPWAAASLLYTMTELGAGALIIQVPVLGLSAGTSLGEAEILYRFDEEFNILNSNIRNLFDAIRTGSLAPTDTPRYVGDLIQLSEQGRERLISELLRRDEEGIISMERAAAFFGQARRPGDLRLQLIRTGSPLGAGASGVFTERDEYSRAQSDRDGVIRRIAPQIRVTEVSGGIIEERILEHIVWGALKERPRERELPTDAQGAILYELPRRNDSYRRISILSFLAYEEADRSLRRLLGEAEALDLYRNLSGERRPPIHHDYALILREGDEPAAWVEARNNYVASLEDFLYGGAELELLRSYEEAIVGAVDEEEARALNERRDEIIALFGRLRDSYIEFADLRLELEAALAGSFCILGRAAPLGSAQDLGPLGLWEDFPYSFIEGIRRALRHPNPTDAEVSALLANSIISGRANWTFEWRLIFLISMLPLFLITFLLKSLGPLASLGAGALLIILTGTAYSFIFVFTGLWLAPLIPAAAGFLGVTVTFFWALFAKGAYRRSFRLAYGAFVSRPLLRSIIRAGEPKPTAIHNAWASVVVIKQAEEGASTQDLVHFQERVSGHFKRAGATIIGTERDLVSVCFGSPLERIYLESRGRTSPYNDIRIPAAPARKAVDLVTDLVRRKEAAVWHFGLDMGYCSFAWTALSGYFALGTPVLKARLLSRMAGNYRAQIILSAAIEEALLDISVKRLDVIKGKGKGRDEPFYELVL